MMPNEIIKELTK